MAREKALRKSQSPGREAARASRHAPARDRRRGLRGIRRERLCGDQARGRGRARPGQQGPALSLLQDQGRAVQGGHPQRHHRAFRRDARADGDDRRFRVEAFLKGPFLSFIQELVGSKRAFIARLLIAEGPQASRAHRLLLRAGGLARHRDADAADRSRHRARRVQADALCATYPQLLFAPVLTAILWRQLFERHHHLDTDGLLSHQYRASDRRDQGAARRQGSRAMKRIGRLSSAASSSRRPSSSC